MRLVSKVMVGLGAVAVAGLGVAGARKLLGARRSASATRAAARGPAAGSMFVGAVDEVELGAGIARPRRGDGLGTGFDPENLPSEHDEINELRNKMPFG